MIENSHPLHVLLISHRFAASGGTEILTQDIARAVSDRGHRVTWMATGKPIPNLDRRITCVPIPVSAGAGYPARWQEHEERVARAVRERLQDIPPVDVIHVTHFSKVGLRLLDLPPLARVPVVATLTDYTTICPDYQLWVRATGMHCTPTAPASDCLRCLDLPAGDEADVASWRRRNLDWLNHRVRAFWTQTPHQAQQFALAEVDMRRLVNDRATYDLPREWEQAPEGPSEPGYLLFAGRLSPEKGLHILLDGFGAWPGDLRLVIVGTLDDKRYERKLRRHAAGDSRIRWQPGALREELSGLLSGARALLVPSQWYENHPMIAEEALALGVPVYCSNVPSMRHLQGTPGLHLVDSYTDPAAWTSALSAAANDSQRPQPHVREARQRFREFIDEIITVYRAEVPA